MLSQIFDVIQSDVTLQMSQASALELALSLLVSSAEITFVNSQAQQNVGSGYLDPKLC